jgi:3,4-dihydroxy 2-butanone 4-phosphate synthase/GTP cyclohydrolase II
MPFATVPEAIEEIRAGRILVVVDDEDRENEGDLTIAAEKVTPEIINFMATHGRGLICLTLTPERCDYLRLPLMSPTNTSNFGTAFCESIDARDGVSTGISASDRTRTILQAIDPDCRPADLARPGHIFPLRAREGGVLVRAGQTEASVDLARLAGLSPAGVICEIMNPDGTMARVPELKEFCIHHGLKMISVAELIRYRMKNERFVRRVAEGCIETEFGDFQTVAYASDLNPEYHLALVLGEVAGRENVLVRMHSRCLYGDVFGDARCECGRLVRESLRAIAKEGSGVLVYLHENGPGFRVENGRLASHGREFLHYQGPAGQRQLQHEHGLGAQILSDLGLHTIRLLTNHPRKIVALEGFGIEIVGQIPLRGGPAEESDSTAVKKSDSISS